MGVEGDHHLHKIRRGSLKEGSKNIWRFWWWYTHSSHRQLIGHAGGWGPKSRGDLSLRLLPTAARKNWAQEQRSETLQAPKKPECRKLKNKRRKSCKLQNKQPRSTCRSSETKLRETGGCQAYKRTAPMEEQFQFSATQQICEIYQKIATHLLRLF